MPPLVLTVICILVCGLLVIAHDAAHVDNKGVMTKEMKKGCVDIFGEGDYEMLTEKKDHSTEPVTFGEKHVDSVIADKENKNCLIEMTCDGYAKGGLHLLVGIDSDGKIAGLYLSDIEKIDTMTAATYSSNGLKKACEEALDIYTVHKREIFA